MHRHGGSTSWFAVRKVDGVGDDGDAEVITLWIERKPGALWAVGRAVALAERHDGAVHADDYVFEGYEMEDAVNAANEALDSDLEVCAGEGRAQDVDAFTSAELLPELEKWFFGRRPASSSTS